MNKDFYNLQEAYEQDLLNEFDARQNPNPNAQYAPAASAPEHNAAFKGLTDPSEGKSLPMVHSDEEDDDDDGIVEEPDEILNYEQTVTIQYNNRLYDRVTYNFNWDRKELEFEWWTKLMGDEVEVASIAGQDDWGGRKIPTPQELEQAYQKMLSEVKSDLYI